MIVEDELVVALLLSELLRLLGHTVCAIEATEAAAVTAASKHKPDLMVVDVLLSEGNGIDAVRKITRKGFIPHFFVTTSAVQCRTSADVLRKPFFESELRWAIQRAITPIPVVSPNGSQS